MPKEKHHIEHKKIITMAQHSHCLDDETLYKYIDGQLFGKELRKAERHLDECSTCLRELSSLLRLTYAPQNEQEKQILASIEPVPAEERVRKIVQQIATIASSNNRIMEKRHKLDLTQLFDNVKKYRVILIKRPRPGYAPAFAAILICLIAGFRYYQTGYQVYTAGKLLERHHRTARNELRLAGDYSPSFAGGLMGNEAPQSYMQKVYQKLAKAQEHGVRSARLAKIQSHYLIVNKKYARADSVLRSQAVADPTSTYNDLGVAAFYQGDIPQAITYLERSLATDSTQTYTLYNLGLIYAFEQNTHQALLYLNRCLDYETDERWRQDIRDIIKTISSEK